MKFADLSPREQTGIRWALGVLGGAVVWFVAIAPAWQVWQSSQSQLSALAQQHGRRSSTYLLTSGACASLQARARTGGRSR